MRNSVSCRSNEMSVCLSVYCLCISTHHAIKFTREGFLNGQKIKVMKNLNKEISENW